MQQFRPGGFNMLPVVVKNLLIINGLFFLATIALKTSMNINLNDILGLHYYLADNFKSWQFVTYMFMHAAIDPDGGGLIITHILFNMFALWMFGNVLENYWGPKRFLFYYLFTGIGAGIVHYFVFYFQFTPLLETINSYIASPSHNELTDFLSSSNFKIISKEWYNKDYKQFIENYNRLINTDKYEAMQLSINFMSQYKVDLLNASVVVGASGAVFGILLAFGMMFPNSLIYVYFAIPVKAKYFVMIYGAIELYSGIANNPGDNVAHFAHLGGMIFGYLIILYWKKKGTLYN
ncbi:MAG TPA: rhomboid family intramembrane serine protease [Bacteroidales bacterium]